MDKEFEYLDDRIKTLEFRIAHPNEYNLTPTIKVKINDGDYYKKELKTLITLKQALAELKAIKEVKPSEALILFRGFKEGMITDNAICITKSYFDDKFPIIEKALLKAQELEKVLEIVKDKWVNLAVLIHSKTVEEYNNNAHTPYNLTEEEFDLVKRWSEK